MKTMWDSASEEVKSAYGREYFDAVFTGTKAAAKEAAKSMAPVVDAMEDAVINVSPSIRYLVDGSIRMVDYNNVSLHVSLSISIGAPVAQWIKRWLTDLAVPSSSPARGEIFSTINRIPLHTAFHYHPPIVLI